MTEPLHLDILPQPDDATCGPTCLHAVYRYFGDDIRLEQVIESTPMLTDGGTLAVLLGSQALRRQYHATIYTFNLHVFDPTWFVNSADLVPRLQAQMAAKNSPKLRSACEAYIDFLQQGGVIKMQDLTAKLLRGYLKRSIPVLTGLSATHLYQCERENDVDWEPDDIRGVPAGHFVVLSGYNKQQRTVHVADPYLPNPLGEQHHYEVTLDRLVCAILLGVLTYDANLLVIEPTRRSAAEQRKSSAAPSLT